MSNPLRAFVQLNASGKVIPGTLTYCYIKPKVGSWKEVELRNTISTNKMKPFVNTYNGKPVPGSLVLTYRKPTPLGNKYKEVCQEPASCNNITPSEVRICSQTWSTKNATITHFQNGDIIPYYENSSDFESLTTPGRTKVQYFSCYGVFDDYPFIPVSGSEQNSCDPDDGAVYGYLYNWYAVSDPRGFAPTGWHVPTITDFETLFSCVAPLRQDVGIALGSTGTLQGENGPWMDANSYGPYDDPPINTLQGNIFTNSTGLSLVPAGGVLSAGSGLLGRVETNFGGYYWTSEEFVINPTTYATWYGIGNNGAITPVGGSNEYKVSAMSVRLIKD